MEPLPPRARLGTLPPAEPDNDARVRAEPDNDARVRAEPDNDARVRAEPDNDARVRAEPDHDNAPRLGLSVPLDRPFSELKQLIVDELERIYVERCIAECASNLSQASRTSGLSRKHLRTLMAKHGIAR